MKKSALFAIFAAFAVRAMAAADGEFSPADMKGLEMWLDAAKSNSLRVTDGSVVIWKDRSTNGYHACHTFGFSPTFVDNAYTNLPVPSGGVRYVPVGDDVKNAQGSRPMVRFYGNSEFAGSALETVCVPASGNEPRTIIVVLANIGYYTFKSNHILHYGSPGALEAYGIAARLGARNTWCNHYWQGGLGTEIDSQSSSDAILVVSYGNGVDRFTVNGGQTVEKQIDLKTAGGAYGGKYGIILGARIDPPHGKAMESGCFDMGEVLVFSRALGVEERQAVEGYLAHKWGMTGLLPADHPYKTSKPAAMQ